MELRSFVKSIPTLPRGTGERAEFKFGNCTYTCENTDEAVETFARNALRTLGRGNPESCAVKTRKPAGSSKQRVLDQFLEDGELENAKHWAEVTGLTIYYFASTPTGKPKHIRKAKVFEPGFVLGHNGRDWTVTHLTSGQSVGVGKTAKEATACFTANKTRTDFKGLIDGAACDFQNF